MKHLKLPLITIILFMLGSCFFTSGTWEDDDKNWERVYGIPLPDTINLIHSWYWRSPHFTVEQELFIEIEYDDEIKNTFTADTTVIELDYQDTINIDFFNDKPEWFVPKPYSSYNIWKGDKDDFDHFILFLDKENKHLYWTDRQI